MNQLPNQDLDEIFELCFQLVTDSESIASKSPLKQKFTVTIPVDPKLTDLEKMIRWVTVFKDTKGFAREKFFEICRERKYYDQELLTRLYMSVHTYARTYRYFSTADMKTIFCELKLPFACFEAVNTIGSLPALLQVYRGVREEPADLEDCGFCWTLDEKIARRFATADHQIEGFIVKGEIDFQKIHGYVTCRDEKEIIASASDVRNKAIYQVR